ncbi:cyclic nucleotide-binding domain-containing protein [Hydrogenophaga sp. 5NK40-0174]|uniref:Crp/Fnr family transcriptional regulator n=1 Tax=Hydrogenophaga sp. 5NK40-0174 TaxID=3127649 RepID=UPI003107CF79
METPKNNPVRFDIKLLAEAVQASEAVDALELRLPVLQWEVIASYMQPAMVRRGQLLIEQGVADRTVYFLQSGLLTVHFEDSKDRIRIAQIKPGSIVGEGAFFSHLERSASVNATEESIVWSLTPLRFRELAARQPGVAVDLITAMAGVLAKRMYNKPKRVAVT